jgi:hypothetical protein
MTDEIQQIAAEAKADPDLVPPVLDENGNVQAAKPPVDYQADAAEIVDFAVDSLVALYPSTEKIYNPEKKQKLTAATARLFEYYKISGLEFLNNPWVGLAIVVVPIAKPTIDAIKKDRAAEALQSVAHQPTTVHQQGEALRPVVDATDAGSLHLKT